MVPDDKQPDKEKVTFGKALKAMNPITTYRPVLNYKGNSEKKRKALLIYVRIDHIIIAATIPLAIIALTIIFPWRGISPLRDPDSSATIFFCYLFSICALMIGYKWSTIYKWLDKHTNIFNHFTFNDYYWEMSNSHLLRIGTFLIIIVFSFLSGLITNRWYVGLPLYILAIIALILTYPTDKRWVKWINEIKQQDATTE